MACTISAPGKVLLAGGYLVLDRHYTGLVFGLDARIHVHVKPLTTSSGVSLEEIIVRSPQFREANWEYGYRLTPNGGGMQVTQLRADSSHELHKNPFIETTLKYVLTYISTLTGPTFDPATVTILADTDYYSQPPTRRKASITRTTPESSRFVDFQLPIWEVHKTGLGSSAALVTSLTAALLTHYLPQDVFSLATSSALSSKSRQILHNLAQAAHCAAQGKVGSGFDVASAVFGSCLYRRFTPSLLTDIGDAGAQGFADRIKALVEESGQAKWDTEIQKDEVKLPHGVRLVMADVDCGSKTPGMVKQVLAWRKEKPEEAEKLWERLQEANEALAAELARMTSSTNENGQLDSLKRRKDNEREEVDPYSPLRGRLLVIRALIREMSAKSGVPIEPSAQTQLLDACGDMKGVVGGVVPGAGGYDAVALLIEDKDEVVRKLQGFLATWRIAGLADADGAQGMGRVRLLGVREDMEGVRVEDSENYKEWTS